VTSASPPSGRVFSAKSFDPLYPEAEVTLTAR
jgi:hypothetical protein